MFVKDNSKPLTSFSSRINMGQVTKRTNTMEILKKLSSNTLYFLYFISTCHKIHSYFQDIFSLITTFVQLCFNDVFQLNIFYFLTFKYFNSFLIFLFIVYFLFT